MNTPVITAAVNMDLYRYEIQALIREFFPGYEVKVLLSSKILLSLSAIRRRG